jgi:DNA-binding GntR family transcriptional regulator
MIYQETHTLTDRAYAGLRRMMSRGELRPGSRLVNRPLARSLKVSQTPVREAIGRLVAEGVAEIVPGAGAFVRQVTAGDLAQLYDLRELIEPFAAAAAARNASEAQVAELAGVCAEWRRLASGRAAGAGLADRWNDGEEQVHGLVLAASRNRFVKSFADNLRLLTGAFLVQRRLPRLLTARSMKVALREHEQIVGAIRGRDAGAAEELMRRHVRNGREHVLALMASPPAPSGADRSKTRVGRPRV